jgi:excisionase family DNA binding protein
MNEPDNKDKPGSSPPLRRLATVKEACAYGKIGETQLYAYLHDGTIKAYKRRTSTLVDLNTIDTFYASLPPFVPLVNRAKNGQEKQRDATTKGIKVK